MIKEDWKVRLHGKSRQGSFTVKSKDAKTSLDAWRIAHGRFISKHGNTHLPHLLFGGLKGVEKIKEDKEYVGLARTIHNALKENIGRSGKSSISKGLHASGARRHQISKGLQKTKQVRKRRLSRGKFSYLEETVASDRGTEQPRTKYSPSDNRYIIVKYNQRRKDIKLTGDDVKFSKYFKGYRPYRNTYSGEPFGN